jgi:hypothetical protein
MLQVRTATGKDVYRLLARRGAERGGRRAAQILFHLGRR